MGWGGEGRGGVHKTDLWGGDLDINIQGSKQSELLVGGVEDVNQASSLHARSKADEHEQLYSCAMQKRLRGVTARCLKLGN